MMLATVAAGGILSDVLGNRVGMRGRLWWLFFVQMTGAVMCVVLGSDPVQKNLANTIGVIVVFSFFIEAACGATYGEPSTLCRRSSLSMLHERC